MGTHLANAQEIKRFYNSEPERCRQHLLENIGPNVSDPSKMPDNLDKRQKEFKPSDFSIRSLAEAIMGQEWVDQLNPKSGRLQRLRLKEDDSVKFTDFVDITGQIMYSAVLEGWQTEEVVFTPLIESVQSDLQDMEKFPGISEIGDHAAVVDEGMEYPRVGVSQNWVHVGPKLKRGKALDLTKESVFGDRTGLLVTRARDTGKWLAINLEKRVINAIIDENAGAASAAVGGHRYHWRGTSYASFQSSTPWINIQTSNGLTDYTDVETAWILQRNITDPFTGEPFAQTPDMIMVTPDNAFAAARVLNSFQNRYDTNPSANTAATVSLSDNLVKTVIGNLKVLSSQRLKVQCATDTDWWFGSLKGIKRVYNWDISTEEQDQDGYEGFMRDIVHIFKVSAKDVVSVIEPRLIVENQA